MGRIATDIYSFARLRESGFTYVDKTDVLFTITSGEEGAQFFMARPRRFEKSLAVSTLKCLFEGRRGLSQSLAIEPKWNWSKKWPILHIDIGSMKARTVEEFETLLVSHLHRRAAESKDQIKSRTMPASMRSLKSASISSLSPFPFKNAPLSKNSSGDGRGVITLRFWHGSRFGIIAMSVVFAKGGANEEAD